MLCANGVARDLFNCVNSTTFLRRQLTADTFLLFLSIPFPAVCWLRAVRHFLNNKHVHLNANYVRELQNFKSGHSRNAFNSMPKWKLTEEMSLRCCARKRTTMKQKPNGKERNYACVHIHLHNFRERFHFIMCAPYRMGRIVITS